MGEIKTNYNQAAEVATGGLVNINWLLTNVIQILLKTI